MGEGERRTRKSICMCELVQEEETEFKSSLSDEHFLPNFKAWNILKSFFEFVFFYRRINFIKRVPM